MKYFLSLCLFLVFAVPAYGDIARPNPAPAPKPSKFVLHTGLTIVPDNKAFDARLQISEASLKELLAEYNDTSAGGTVGRGISPGSNRTMIAGVFMFLSLSFAGVWLARSMQTRGQKVAAGLLLATAVISVAAVMTQANAGPPGSYYWRKLSQNLAKGTSTSAAVSVEVVPGDESDLKLIIPTRPQ